MEYVQPNFLYKEASDVNFNDPFYNNQWYLHNTEQLIQTHYKGILGEESMHGVNNVDINYPEARKIYNTAYNRLNNNQKSPILIGVIDNGIDYNHEEFAGKLWDGSNCKDPNGRNLGGCKYGYDTGDNDRDPFRNSTLNKKNEHGTQVSGLIVAQENNNKGIVGIHPHAKLVSVKIKNSSDAITSESIINGIAFMERNNISIVNMSIASDPTTSEHVDLAVYNAIRNFPGIIVNSAGNNNVNIDIHNYSFVFPGSFRWWFGKDNRYYASLTNLVTVWAEQPDGTKRETSNYGRNSLDIFAPGWWIHTTSSFEDKYQVIGGTSFAAPIVTASLALAKQAYPNKTWSELRQLMNLTATPVSTYKNISISGGRLNLGAMMEALEREYQNSAPLTATISANITTPTNQNITLTLRANKNIETPATWTKVNDTTFTKIISANGSISVTIRNSLWETTTVTHNVTNINKIAPTTTITSPENNSKILETVSVVFSGNDVGSGIARYECRKDNSEWRTCTSPQNITVNNQSEINFSVRSIDIAGNIWSPANIRLQNAPLTGNITSSNTSNSWTNQNITLTLRTNKNIRTPEGWNKISDKEFRKIISENGNISVNFSNEYGQSGSTHFRVEKIDKIKPTVTITSPSENIRETRQPSIILEFSGNDAGSGIARDECRYMDVPGDSWAECRSPGEFPLTPGNNIIGIRSIDNAGNISLVTSKTITRQDTGNEEILSGNLSIVEYLGNSFTKNNKTWTNTGVRVKLTTNKAIHTPEDWTKISDTEFSKDFLENQNISVIFVAKEKRERNSANLLIDHIDKISPENITFTPNEEEITVEYSTENFSLNFSSQDQESGIKKYQCREQNNEWKDCSSPKNFSLNIGNNIFSIRAVDQVGNMSPAKNITIIRKENNNSGSGSGGENGSGSGGENGSGSGGENGSGSGGGSGTNDSGNNGENNSETSNPEDSGGSDTGTSESENENETNEPDNTNSSQNNPSENWSWPGGGISIPIINNVEWPRIFYKDSEDSNENEKIFSSAPEIFQNNNFLQKYFKTPNKISNNYEEFCWYNGRWETLFQNNFGRKFFLLD